MLVGHKGRFAIEANIESIEENWVFGSIRFWVESKSIGNWEDATALNACYNWLQEFSLGAKQTTSNDLFNIPATQAYELIMAELRGVQTKYARNLTVDDPHRFDISTLGMSSFDNLDILLIKNESGIEKCIWKIGNGQIDEATFPANTMEIIASEFCTAFEKEAPQLTRIKYPEK